MASNNHFLIDTHIFIWWMGKSSKLSKNIVRLLNNPENYIFLSIASVWEIIIKQGKEKLRIPQDIEGGIKESGFILLPIEISHVLRIRKLPSFHRDPFDRILIAQTIVEHLTLVTDDAKMKKYDVRLMG